MRCGLGHFLDLLAHVLDFVLYGSWEALDSLNILPRGAPTFSTPGKAIPRLFEKSICWTPKQHVVVVCLFYLCFSRPFLIGPNGPGPRGPMGKGSWAHGPGPMGQWARAHGPGPGPDPGPMGKGPWAQWAWTQWARVHGPGPGPTPWGATTTTAAEEFPNPSTPIPSRPGIQ